MSKIATRDAYGKTLVKLGETNDNVVVLDADLSKSTKTNDIIFDRTCDLYLDLSTSSGSGGALGALIDLAASAINTAITDHIVAARKCNAYIFSDLPRGKYNPEHGVDMEIKASEKNTKVNVK